MRLTLLGQMEARTPDDTSVLPLGRKTRALLAILALSAPRPVVRARLAELLWSRRHEEQARASLRQEIHRLLDALQPAGSDILTVTRDHVALRLDYVTIDVDAVLLATPADPSGLDRLKGKLLDEFDGLDPAFDIWLAAERERLQDRARAVGERLLRQPMEPEAMIPVAQRLLGVDRAHEGAWRALMGAYAARGDRGMAVQAYERCRAVLKEKLDATPSQETQRLLAGIRAGNTQAATPSESAPPEPAATKRDGVRIGVLPLQMLGTGPAEAHLSVSLADEITTALAAFHGVYPVSSASLQLHGSRDERALQRVFGLHYLVDGSVQRAGDRLRVNVRLLDLEDGDRVAWAHRFDSEVSNLLSLQDQITAEAAGQLYPEIMRLEFRHAVARPLATAGAYDLILRAAALMARLRREDFDEAGSLLNRALALEPDHAGAHAWRAYWLTMMASQGWIRDLESVRREAGNRLERAIALDCGDAHCLALAGIVRSLLHRQPREALDLHERSLAINPNLPMAVGFFAVTLTYLGDIAGAQRQFATYDRLAPLGQMSFFLDAAQTLLELIRGDDEAAVRAGRRSTELHPNLVPGLQHYLCALGHAGHHREAKLVLRRLLAIDPGLTIEAYVASSPLHRPVDIERYVAGLRLAGVPEGEVVAA